MVTVEPYYMKQAKELTDLLFDRRFLADDCSRESMDWLQEYIGYLFQSHIQMAIKTHDLLKKSRDMRAVETQPPGAK